MKAGRRLLLALFVAAILMAAASLHATEGAMLESGVSAAMSLSAGSAYTMHFDAGSNVSFDYLDCNITSGSEVRASVGVWEDAAYTKRKGLIELNLVVGSSSRAITVPTGRYANVTIWSSSAWGISSANLRTSTKPAIRSFQLFNSTMGSPQSYGRESIKAVVNATGPGGASDVKRAQITIKNPEGLSGDFPASMTAAWADNATFTYTYTIPASGSLAKAGMWTANVSVFNEAGLYVYDSRTFTVRPAPTAAVSVIPAEAVYDSTDIACEIRPLSDFNGGQLPCWVSWLKNSTNVSSLLTRVLIANGSVGNATLGAGNTSVNETWKCSVLVDDGTEKSGSIVSANEKFINPAGFSGCSDSDGGIVNETAGHTVGKDEGGTDTMQDRADQCTDTKALKEYYCKTVGSEKRVSYQTVTCTYRCADGACIVNADTDGDGYSAAQGDCNDNDALVNPGMLEICNNAKDDNCNGKVDEDPCICKEGDTKVCGGTIGACLPGHRTCSNREWSDCAGGVQPKPEICGNAIDDDCDGLTDLSDTQDCQCITGQTKVCGSNVGECRQGEQSCANGRWSDCAGRKAPTPEVCNGKDDDCDGTVDNDCVEPSDVAGLCSNGVQDASEDGVDCGGICAKACVNDTGPVDSENQGTGVELWIAVAALGLLIMGATGVFIVFSKKPSV